MKKILCICLVLICVLLTGCGAKETKKGNGYVINESVDIDVQEKVSVDKKITKMIISTWHCWSCRVFLAFRLAANHSGFI